MAKMVTFANKLDQLDHKAMDLEKEVDFLSFVKNFRHSFWVSILFYGIYLGVFLKLCKLKIFINKKFSRIKK